MLRYAKKERYIYDIMLREIIVKWCALLEDKAKFIHVL